MASVAAAGTTGQLVGYTYDGRGAPLRGVLVSATSPSLIGSQITATSGQGGLFRFARLPPGVYTVRFERPGHVPQQLEGVQVWLDRVTEVDVTLPRASFAAEIEVAETTPVVDPVQTSTAQSFTSSYITATRTDWTNLIDQTAGASQDFRRVLGSTPQDGGYLLDGMDSTNWYQRFPNLAAFDLPFDAVQEVVVHSAGFEPEYGQATGAVVNVTTKSGGNRFSGTLDARYTGSDLETSGEHYDPDEQPSEEGRLAATLGGPILRDRLWFFTSFSRGETDTTPFGAPTTESWAQTFNLGKLTWLANPSWRLMGKYSFAPVDQRNVGSSQFRTADATSEWNRDPSIATVEAAGVLSPDLLLDVRLGRKDWDESGVPQDGDLRTIGHYNLVTGELYGNWASQWYAETTQNEVASDLTWFAEAAGSHEVKLGGSAGDPQFIDTSCLNGSGSRCEAGVEGYFFRDLVDVDGQPVPYVMSVQASEGALEYGGTYYTAFAQDAWRLRPNLTLKAGLRWDQVVYDNQAGEIADLSKLQPRVGVAWDVFNDGKTSVRASWGRFMHPGTTILASLTNETSHPTEYWLSCSTLISADPEVCAAVAGGLGLGYRSDPEGWDPAGWVLDPANVVASLPSQTADDLQAASTDQWLVGIERELWRRTSVELTYVNKASGQGFDDTCNGNYPERDPEGACDFYIVANLPEVRWDYEGLLLRFESRALDNFHVIASYALSESKGSMDYNTGATGNFDFYPNHFVNRYGYLQDHSRHRVKLNGYWMLPYDFSLAFDGWWQSEFRWTPYDPTAPGMPYGEVFVEPRGNRSGDDLHQLDLQVSKGFRIGPTRLVLIAAVINATDSQTGDEICGSVTGCGEYDFGDAIEWQQPRRYELGFRVEF